MSAEDFRELANFHHRQGLELSRAVEKTDGRPAVKQGLAAKAAWHLTMSTKLSGQANSLQTVTKSPLHHA